jgi:acetylornithine deacetylase
MAMTLTETTVLLQDLVKIPSVSPSLAPDEGTGEGEVAAFAVDWLKARGIEAWIDDVAPGRPNAVGRIVSGTGPTLVLYGHTDTVQTSNMSIPPFEPRIEGDRMYGRGSYDMKCGVAAVLIAAERLARRGDLGGTVLLALVSDEEHASIGAQAFVEKYAADGCIIAEPTDGKMISGHRGFAWVDVEVKGRAAHGSRWNEGISANTEAGKLLVAFDAFDRNVLRARTHPLVGPASMHPAVVRGGAGLSTYAPSCLIQLERRSIPGETEAQIVDELEAIVREAGVSATVRSTLFRAPMICPPGARVREALMSAIGGPVEEVGSWGWMDAALFDAMGIPTIVYGPSGEGAHAAVEWVDLPSVERCAEIYYRAALDFFGK